MEPNFREDPLLNVFKTCIKEACRCCYSDVPVVTFSVQDTKMHPLLIFDMRILIGYISCLK